MSAFLPGTSQACTGTVDGDVVVWSMKEGAQDASDRIATKVVRAHSAPITYLTVAGQYLVTGGGEGFVRLFDSKLRIIAWFEDIGHGSITSVAFADGARTRSPSPAAASAADDLPGPAVAVPDFAVTTSRHMVVEVPSASFSAPQQCRPIISGVSGQIACIAAHPDAPILAVGTRGGRVELWDTEKHVRLAQAALPHNAPPSVMRYSRVGGLLAVGTAAGHVVLYDGRSARESAVVRNTRAPILHLDVGRSSDRVIAGDAQGCLLLYAQQPMRGVLQWELLGKFRGHGAGLAGVAFLDDRQGYETLVSMGRDGAVCEFDLGACSHSEGMVLNDARTFPPSRFPGRPGCLAVVPPSVRLCEQQCRGAAVLCADETLKLRLLDLDHAKTTVTVLGPTFGGAVRMLQPFVAHGTGVPCVAYATEDKVCGIVVGPVDGCPDKTLGVIAHPGPISGIAVSHDGARVFTSSGEDPIVNVWRVGAAATEEMSRLGGEVADWVAAVEGGMDGAMMQEIQDTFYYCQVLAQKEPSLTHVPGRIPGESSVVGYVPCTHCEASLVSGKLTVRYREIPLCEAPLTVMSTTGPLLQPSSSPTSSRVWEYLRATGR